MMKTTKLFAVAALSAFAAFGAHADEADGSQFAINFNSTRSVAEVKAEALTPVKVNNGSTGFIGVTKSGLDRSDVRAEAISALRNGEIPQGEIGYM
ncbi:MAG: DUF4148 domain-containing protein [Polaromonas sp.]|nr:DUF4148 domain-containing protein [Polaromonas sp.]MDP1743033.1 DUF4148 domain-containing protein [Polaromonas sp.]MDP1954396.1 DUF4148 domain-containing protein [Polaromonas sp.]MDP3356318.1 DUF4148 domain-containing protein [Polaromonas sp.]